jgi:hypothetical protein
MRSGTSGSCLQPSFWCFHPPPVSAGENKKTLQAKHTPEGLHPAFLTLAVSRSPYHRGTMIMYKAGILALGSSAGAGMFRSPSPRLPIHLDEQWRMRRCPRLQRRDRSRFSRDSLLNPTWGTLAGNIEGSRRRVKVYLHPGRFSPLAIPTASLYNSLPLTEKELE